MKRSGLLLKLLALVVFVALGWILPDWMVFLLTNALARGLVVLGVVLLMRAGLISFGQALFFGAGAYAAGFVLKHLQITDLVLLVAIGTVTATLLAALVGLLVARYREIFFAMLTMAFSMAFYGVLVKAYSLTGGTDGLRLAGVTFFGRQLAAAELRLIIYLATLAAAALGLYLVGRYVASPLGHLITAIRDNEVRVQYLGASVHRAVYFTFVLTGALSGLGGTLQAISIGHIDPHVTYWTTSGDFVFVALISGISSVVAPLAGSIVFEFVRSYASSYAPYTWQMVLGVSMLMLVLFLPQGLWSLIERAGGKRARRDDKAEVAS